jgi:hypothetical protein
VWSDPDQGWPTIGAARRDGWRRPCRRDDAADARPFAQKRSAINTAVVARFPSRIINIHHSFLPAFVGANRTARRSRAG